MTLRSALDRIFRAEEINGDGRCPTYLFRWTLLRVGKLFAEVPPTWGYMVAEGRSLRTVREAPAAANPEKPDLPFICSILRNVHGAIEYLKTGFVAATDVDALVEERVKEEVARRSSLTRFTSGGADGAALKSSRIQRSHETQATSEAVEIMARRRFSSPSIPNLSCRRYRRQAGVGLIAGEPVQKRWQFIKPTQRSPQGNAISLRRLLPLEWEMLQGFPRHWTCVKSAKKAKTRRVIADSETRSASLSQLGFSDESTPSKGE